MQRLHLKSFKIVTAGLNQINTLYSLLTCRQIEGRVVEISQLQEVFSEKVLHQVRDLALQCQVPMLLKNLFDD